MKFAQQVSFALVIALLLSSGFVLATENKDALNAKRVEALLLSLPGHVQTSVTEVEGDTLTIRGLTASLRMREGEVTARTVLSIDEIVCTGVDFNGLNTPGVQRLAADVRVTGYTSRVDLISPQGENGIPFFSQKILMRNASINGLSGDVRGFSEAAYGTGSLARLLQPLLSFEIDSMNMEEMSISYLEATETRARVDIQASTAHKFGLLHSGPVKMEGVVLEVDGRKALRIDSAGHESLRFTDLAEPFMSLDFTKPNEKIEEDLLLAMMNSLKALSFSMEGLHVTGVRTMMPELGDNSLRRMSGTLTTSFSEMKIDGSVKELTLSPALYAFLGHTGKALAGRYGESIQFSGGMRATISNSDNGGSVTLNELRAAEPNLGDFALSLKLVYSPGILALFNLPNAAEHVRVQEADLMLEDRGIGDLFFAMLLEENKQVPDAKLLSNARSEAALSILKASLDKGGKYAEAAGALAQLCSHSGAVKLRLHPEAAIPVDHIINFRPLEDLEVQYSSSEKRVHAQ